MMPGVRLADSFTRFDECGMGPFRQEPLPDAEPGADGAFTHRCQECGAAYTPARPSRSKFDTEQCRKRYHARLKRAAEKSTADEQDG